MKDELDIVNLIRTIQKLKAGLSVVIDDNIALQNQAKKLYFTQNTIYFDRNDERLYTTPKNEFYKFLQSDLVDLDPTEELAAISFYDEESVDKSLLLPKRKDFSFS